MVDLSSEEEDAFPDTSQDEELAKQLFGDLNCGLLRPFSDGNIIILRTLMKKRRCTRRMSLTLKLRHPLL
jgi:hypothetical protein